MVDAKGFLYRCFSLDVLVEYRKWIVGKPHFRKRIPFTGFFGKKKVEFVHDSHHNFLKISMNG